MAASSAASSDSDDAPLLVAAGPSSAAPAAPAAAAAAPTPPVGVTLLTGFLGSGKSTLVRRILTEPHGRRVLVVENEFGDRVSSSIEAAVVTPAGGGGLAELVSLPNGCVCCAASADLTSSLAKLLRSGRRFDHVLVEASGLADPGPVAAAFWVDAALETHLYLDAIIAVVDASSIARTLASAADNRRALAEKQIAVADAVLLNKTDLAASAGTLAAARASVRGLAASDVRVLECVRSDVDIGNVLDLRAYAPGRAGPCAAVAGDVVHVSGVGSVSVVFEGVQFAARALDLAFGSLLWEDGRGEDGSREVWRAKALAAVEGEAGPVLYQAVHTLYEGGASDVIWKEGEVRVSRFVFIGRGLEETHVRAALAEAIVPV